jgi:hypothetical protein
MHWTRPGSHRCVGCTPSGEPWEMDLAAACNMPGIVDRIDGAPLSCLRGSVVG